MLTFGNDKIYLLFRIIFSEFQPSDGFLLFGVQERVFRLASGDFHAVEFQMSDKLLLRGGYLLRFLDNFP